MRVLGKRVVCSIRILPPVTEGGIYLPINARKKQLEADVVYVGDEVKGIEVKDHVIVDLYAGKPFKDELVLFNEEDIIAKVVNDEEKSD